MARRYLLWWVSTGTALVVPTVGWHASDLPASGRHYRFLQLDPLPITVWGYLLWWVSTGTALVGVNLG